MKSRLPLLALILLAIAVLACSTDISFADPTATPSPMPTPSFEACSDPAVAAYLMEAEKLVLRYAKLSRQFQGSFDAGDKEAMRLDLENVQQITAEIEALTPPPLYATYQSLLSKEMRGFTQVMATIFAGDTDLAEAIAAETDQIDIERLAETARINQFCRPPSLRKEAGPKPPPPRVAFFVVIC
ncbi:MAG TPA: hypothetical protein VI791_01940 [Patescibacteria group bacterium]|nr:hypothetical protein [Patescibacteria group bacterium]